MKKQKSPKKNEAREDMETGDTARSGTQSGTPPEYETTATDFLSQLAPPGLQLFFSFIPSACTRSGLRTHKLSQASYTPRTLAEPEQDGTDLERHPLDAGALGGLGGSEGRDDGVLSHHWRVPLGTKSALARWRNLFPVEQFSR